MCILWGKQHLGVKLLESYGKCMFNFTRSCWTVLLGKGTKNIGLFLLFKYKTLILKILDCTHQFLFSAPEDVNRFFSLSMEIQCLGAIPWGPGAAAIQWFLTWNAELIRGRFLLKRHMGTSISNERKVTNALLRGFMWSTFSYRRGYSGIFSAASLHKIPEILFSCHRVHEACFHAIIAGGFY